MFNCLLAKLLDGVFLGDPDSEEKQMLLAEIASAVALGYGTQILQPKPYPSASGAAKCCSRRGGFVLEQITNTLPGVTEMPDFPRSLIEFQQRFGDEAACAQYLAAARWPDGFACPGCGGNKAWRLETKAWTYECAGCGRQTSVTAGTIMHHSKLPLTIHSGRR